MVSRQRGCQNDDIWGIGFKTADTIATKLGFGHDKYVRLRSGLMYTLNKLAEDGHCYGTCEQLLEKGASLLAVDTSLLSMTLDEMIRVGDVKTTPIPTSSEIRSDETEQRMAIYLPPFFFSEVGVENRLRALYKAPASYTPRMY